MGIQAISSSTATNSLSQLTQSRSLSESTAASQTSTPAAQKAGGGGASAKAAPSSSSTSSSSASSLLYDVRDLNQDGIVSPLEELLYALKNPLAEEMDKGTVSSSQLQNGLKAYQQGQQANSTVMKSPISI